MGVSPGEHPTRPRLAKPPAPPVPSEWALGIRASATAVGSAAIVVGAHPDANDDLDEQDREAPPTAPDRRLRLQIANPEWPARAGFYGRDLRSTSAEGHVWNLELHSVTPAEGIALSLDRMEVLPEAIRLIDVEQGVSCDFLGSPEYRILAFGVARPYRLMVVAGSRDFVAREGKPARWTAAGVDAGAEFPESPARIRPNPFRPLPPGVRGAFACTTCLGRLVASVLDRSQLPAGFHAAVWTGSPRAASVWGRGVYFYRLQTEEGARSRKLLVLR